MSTVMCAVHSLFSWCNCRGTWRTFWQVGCDHKQNVCLATGHNHGGRGGKMLCWKGAGVGGRLANVAMGEGGAFSTATAA